MEKAVVEKILCGLEERGLPFPRFKLYKNNGQPQLLGSGGFSAVYEMVDAGCPQKHYALKVEGLDNNEESADAFWTAVRLQRILCEESPYIVRILMGRELEVVVAADGEVIEVWDKEKDERNAEGKMQLRFVLEEKLDGILVTNRFQRVMLAREELTEETEIIQFAMQIGQAVQSAHANKVLHRDIKLENIFYDENSDVYKLGDFGTAKQVVNGMADTVVYTDGYGAPEIERRLCDGYNETADIYSFGITLYLLLNDLKFPGSEGYYANLVQYNPEFVFPAPRNASEAMTRVIRKMCSYHSEDRYQSMNEVLADLSLIWENGHSGNVEVAEYPDIDTETYSEDEPERKQNNLSGHVERKRQLMEEAKKYRNSMRLYLAGFTVLFLTLLCGIQPQTMNISQWQFWIFPLAVLVEAFLLHIREYQFSFGICVLILGVYSVYSIGGTVVHVLLFACMLIGIPVVTAAGAIATGIWIFLVSRGNVAFVKFWTSHDLSWIIVVCIMVLIYKIMWLRIRTCKYSSFLKVKAGVILYDLTPVVMLIAGIVLWILQRAGMKPIPVVQKLHLIRTGIVLWIVYAMLEDDDEGEEDAPEKGENVTDDDGALDK